MKKIFLLICTVLLGVSAFAQEVSLVTSGEGVTKDAATASALRSAIEQSFGVFVSANTTILNDDIVRDEVATVASGNIKSYKVLSCVQNNAGIYNVSVNAVVSIGKLISYAKAHGSSTEFAGQTFVMEIKMRELNKKNEYEALQNLLVQLELLPGVFDGVVTANEPRQIPGTNEFCVPVGLQIKTNQNFIAFYDALFNTLSSLSLSPAERGAYDRNNMKYTRVYEYIYLRNDEEVVSQFVKKVCKILDSQTYAVQERGNGGCERGWRDLFDWERLRDRFNFGFYKSGSLVGLTRESGLSIANLTIDFRYTMDQLGTLRGFEAVPKKYAVMNEQLRLENALLKLGIPYDVLPAQEADHKSADNHPVIKIILREGGLISNLYIDFDENRVWGTGRLSNVISSGIEKLSDVYLKFFTEAVVIGYNNDIVLYNNYALYQRDYGHKLDYYYLLQKNFNMEKWEEMRAKRLTEVKSEMAILQTQESGRRQLERRRQQELDRNAREKQERKIREEQERKDREEQERKVREEQERKAKEQERIAKDKQAILDLIAEADAPYAVEGDSKVKILLKKEQEIVLDLSENKLLTPLGRYEIARINQYGVYIEGVSGPYLSLWSGHLEAGPDSGKKIRYRYR